MSDLNLNMYLKLAGRFKLTAVDEHGNERQLADFDNLILDQGLDRIASSNPANSVINSVQVGTGSTAPAVGQTGLVTFLTGTVRNFTSYSFNQGAAPYLATTVFSWQFDQGAAAGNLSEVGVGWGVNGATLFSRALIVDGGGSPTTITVLANEFLTVTYTLTCTPPATDVVTNVTVNAVSTTCTLRAANVANWAIIRLGYPMGGIIGAYITQGTLGGITTQPSGTYIGGGLTLGSYTPGSRSLVYTLNFDINANVPTNQVSSCLAIIGLVYTNVVWQIGFNPPLPKDNTKTLAIDITMTWGR